LPFVSKFAPGFIFSENKLRSLAIIFYHT
jgi:hypothetical protein